MQDNNEKKGISRRRFIAGAAGVVGVAAIAATPVVSILNRTPAKAAGAATAGQDAARAIAAAHTGDSKTHRAWCMVIDLKKCDGCVTIDAPPGCTQACIAGHFAPKGQQWIEVFTAPLPGGGTYFLPTPCFQCENAPCVNVCPVAATYHNEQGIVLIDHKRCIGCRLCMSACPYQRRFFNWGTPELPPEAAFAEYSPHYPVPAVKGTVIKCMFCAHLLHAGKLPLCVLGCPMKALYMGDLNADIASNGNEVVKLSTFLDQNDAFRYKEALGTQPRVYYLPGHGQEIGRRADDPRVMKPAVWTWGGEGPDRQIPIWPWGETDTWTWEAQPK